MEMEDVNLEEIWQSWCRLCGKISVENSIADGIETIKESGDIFTILEKYFNIKFSNDVKPINICSECVKFSIQVENFAQECSKVDKMFTYLIAIETLPKTKNLNNIRIEFGLDSHNAEIFSQIEIKLVEEPILESTPTTEHKIAHRKRATKSKKQLVVKRRDSREIDADEYSDIKEEIEESGRQSSADDEQPISRKKKKSKNATWICPICSKVFEQPHLRSVHLKTEHSADKKPFKCNICPKTFSKATNLKMHGNTHLPESEKMVHKCPHCLKCFSKSVNVTAHIQNIHIAERRFVCDECGRLFLTKGALDKHYSIHTEERPFLCSMCPKSFKSQHQLKIHSEIHSSTQFECNICNKKLNTRRTLREHMTVHSDVRNYRCHLCGNEFKRKKNLNVHLASHSGKKFAS